MPNKNIDDKNSVRLGKYEHYKSKNLYEVIGVGIHSETTEEMIIYKSLCDHDKFAKGTIWIRPKKMFLEYVVHDGKTVPRFRYIE